jgi:GDP-mannose 6-dehydrogenase
LRPGFAFGGSCLAKDLSALLYQAKMRDLHLPVLESILPSNHLHIQRAVDLIISLRKKKIGILGLSFKAGTDDLRESPMVMLAKRLLAEGYDLKIYDRVVSPNRLIGANKEYMEKEIPVLSRLLNESLDEVLQFAEIIVIGNADPEFAEVLNRRRPHQIIVDLVRAVSDEGTSRPNCVGIC